MATLADKIIAFNTQLRFMGQLPDGIRIMNPFRDNPYALESSSQFYQKYYADNNPRRIILGINPGRHGAGLTGVPFTDPKRLVEVCGIPFGGLRAHEPSSVFVYEVAAAYGGPEAFFGDFYINSPCPLGFTKDMGNGNEVNYNYYDSPALTRAVHDFMLDSMEKHLALGILRDRAYCMGTGQNFKFLNRLNAEHGYFKELIPLEHPRFVMQYKSKSKLEYIEKYLGALGMG
jgi:hypothetical protein